MRCGNDMQANRPVQMGCFGCLACFIINRSVFTACALPCQFSLDGLTHEQFFWLAMSASQPGSFSRKTCQYFATHG
jgi:hypothetical protein